jgi:transposase
MQAGCSRRPGYDGEIRSRGGGKGGWQQRRGERCSSGPARAAGLPAPRAGGIVPANALSRPVLFFYLSGLLRWSTSGRRATEGEIPAVKSRLRRFGVWPERLAGLGQGKHGRDTPSPIATVGGKGLVMLPKDWIVERTFSRLARWRRRSKDYERCPKPSEAMIYSSLISLMSRRLAAAGT